MNIGKINNNSNFGGILKYNKTIVKKTPNYTRKTFEYNYYPFADETDEEIKIQKKEFLEKKGGLFWDGYTDTGEYVGGMTEYTMVQKPRLNITENDYIALQLQGLSNKAILDKLKI